MSKTRDLADFTSAGNPLADGTIDVADINGVTASAAEINILDGLTATTEELNGVAGINTSVQTQLDAKVDLAGDTMTGALILNADPTVALGASTKQYVDTSIANLVDTAPSTLDTLNELAAALGDDANFSTTVTNSLALKANSADLGTAATQDVGTSAGNVVQLDGSAKLPAVDGSALTGIEGVPSGIIAMWSGSTASIPSGWVICDGNNSTPDLRDRFIVGAGSTYAVDATGGSNTVTLTESEMPGHTHTISGNTSTTGAHTHTLSGNTGNSGNHTHTGSTSNTGSHGHVFRAQNGGTGTSPGSYLSAVNTQWGTGNSGNIYANVSVQNGGAHSHNLTIDAGGDHSHTLSGNAASAGDHSHTLSATAASTGGGNAHENRPPYYALAYIMKT